MSKVQKRPTQDLHNLIFYSTFIDFQDNNINEIFLGYFVPIPKPKYNEAMDLAVDIGCSTCEVEAPKQMDLIRILNSLAYDN